MYKKYLSIKKTVGALGAVVLFLYTQSTVYASSHTLDLEDLTGQDLIDVVVRLVGFAAVVLPAAAAIIFLLIAGYYYITSRGNAGRMAQAKDTATKAVIGFIIIISAGLILTLISNTFGFELEYLSLS